MSPTRMLLRAMAMRCPVCGSGRIFRRWFTMAERCPRCGLTFERIEGQWVGSLGVNTIVTFGVLLVVVVAGLVVQYPDFDVLPLTLLAVGTALFVGIFFFPFSRTVWTAVDVMMRPLEPGEVDPAFMPAPRSRPPSRR